MFDYVSASAAGAIAAWASDGGVADSHVCPRHH